MVEIIKVLIVDDIEETRKNIRKSLAFEDRIDVIGEAENGYQAIDMACKYKPDIILMDINMPELDGIQATEKITFKCPNSSVIVVSVQGEQEYLKRAMLVGAKEFLIKPFSPDELISTIINVYELKKQKIQQIYAHQVLEQGYVRTPKTITIISGKGGVGKSLLAVNLAVALNKLHKKVALIDLDLMFGDIAPMFNLKPKETIYHVVQEIERLDSDSILPFLIETKSGIHILAAPTQPEQSEIITGKHVEKIVRLLKDTHDYVIVDTPAQLNDPVLALEQSDFFLLVNTLNVPVIKHNRTILDLMGSLNFPLDNVRIIVNRADLETGVNSKDVKTVLGVGPYRLFPEDRNVDLSINRGEPLLIMKPNSKWSRQVDKLAEQIVGEDERKNTKSLLSKIRFNRKKA